jgi:hypothetical protein
LVALTFIVALALICAAIYLLAWLTTDYSSWSRILVWRGATYDDFKTKFAARAIDNAGPPLALVAPTSPSSKFAEIGYLRISDRSEHAAPTVDFLAGTQTRALVALKDRRIIFESYGGGADHDSLVSSFSIAKSALSASPLARARSAASTNR